MRSKKWKKVSFFVVFLIVISMFAYFNFFYTSLNINMSLLYSESNIDAYIIAKNLGLDESKLEGNTYSLKGYDASILKNKTLYSESRTFLKINNLELYTYKTKVRIKDIYSSPLKRKIVYEIYNSSPYFILSKNDGEISIKVYDIKGRKVKIEKIKKIDDIQKEFKRDNGWVREVKEDLSNKGLSVQDIEDIFYDELLPPEGWINILYKIPDNIEYPITITLESPPQYAFKFFYFDPYYSGWWNESWEYRSIYHIKNNNSYSLDNYPILLVLNSTNFPWDLSKSDLSDLRVTQFNETQQREYEMPYFVEYVNWQDKIAYVWIRAENFTANRTITIFLYHGNKDAVDESNLSGVASFMDDFESGSLDTTKWSVVGTVNVETDPVFNTGILRVEGGNQQTGVCTSTYIVPANSIIGYYARPESPDDWDTGMQVGNIYFISDTITYGASPIIDTAWNYPSGSQGPDTKFHFYRLKVEDGYQEMTDYTSGGSTSAAFAYTPGSLCTITDSDSTARDALYDLIYVMELPENGTILIYNTTEYVGYYYVNITTPKNNQKVYRYESFYLNATLNASGFDLYDKGDIVLTDYDDFIKYDSKENITIVDVDDNDYLELAGQTNWYPGYKDWKYRMPINITNRNNVLLKDHQVNVTINTQQLISAFKMNDTCQDIRFTYYNETSRQEVVIPYWLESGCNTPQTVIWVKIPELKANSNTTIYLYYGNNNTFNESSGDDVFIFFDDFEDLYQDPNKWYPDAETTEELDPVYDVGVMRVQGGNEILGSCSVPTIPSDVYIDFYMRSESTADFDSGWLIGNIYFISDSGAGSQCIDTTVCFPAGSQTDTTFHHYRITLLSGYQHIIDLNTGDTASNTITYAPGSICGFSDSDSSLRDVFYDLIYVRKYAEIDIFDQYNGTEEENNYIYYENGSYLITLDMLSASVNYTNITYYVDIPLNTNVDIFARTSPNKIKWSDWNLVVNGSYPNLPGERYLQFMIHLNTTDNKTSPKLYGINISYERVKNSPYAWSQYFSVVTPLKKYVDDTYSDFINYTYAENITVGYDGSLYLNNTTWSFGMWKYRLPINITNNNAQILRDFQINVIVDTASLISQGKMKPGCEDIRFTYYNITDKKEYNISYWIESGCNTTSTSIWVKIPYVYLGSDTLLYMYYGNPYAESLSNPYKVFDFYDDFESGVIDETKWTGSNTQIVFDPVVNRYAAEVPTGNQVQGICTIQTFNAPFIVESHLRPTTTGDFDSGWLISDIYFITDTSGTGSPGIRQGTWVYPTGSHGADTSYHFYKIEMQDASQVFTDLTNGQSATATYTYTPGSICFVNDGDGDAASRFDDIRVRKLAGDMNFAQTIGNEETYNSTFPSGTYISKIIDVETNEYEFGNFYWYGRDDPNGDGKFYVRTSPDGITWTGWYLVSNNTLIEAPPNRYVQYKWEIFNNDVGIAEVVDKVVIEYKIASAGFVIMTPSSIFSTSNPETCPLEEVKQNPNLRLCNVSWSVIPKQEGNYTLRVKVNSTNIYMEESYSQEINISVFIRTSIIDFTITPPVQGQRRKITLRARLVDDLSNPLSGYNISFYDSTTGKWYGDALTSSNGYGELIYTIPKDEVLGYHTVYAIFNGSWPDFLEKSNASLQYKVSSVPQINALYTIPYWQGNNQIVRLRANITDKVGVDTVLIYIYNSTNALVVDGAKMTPIGNDLYEYNFSSWHADKFKFYVWVNNTDGITNTSDFKDFVVDVKAEISVKTEKDKYENYEYVYLSNYDYDWFNTSWMYRLPIELYNPNSYDVYYDAVNITLNTGYLISQGKMKPACEDLRLTIKKNVYVVELNITNNKAVSFTDRSVKMTISNRDIVSNFNDDGSDIRIFENKVEDPYSRGDYLNYWVERIDKETGNAIIWVKIPYIGAYETKTLYLYYGNKNAIDKQNYSAVFDTVIGEARTFILNSSVKTINFLRTYSQSPVVIASLNSENEVDQAFVRITSVTTSGFDAFIQESIALDGTHVFENASYIALLPGEWLVGGRYLEVGTGSVDSNYATLTFTNVFSSKPIVLSQILTNNEADPAKTRQNNILTGGFDVKIEETDTVDTPHTFETVGYVASEMFNLKTKSMVINVGFKNHDQPSANDWFTYRLEGFSSIPVVVAKIMTENGPDNAHERIRNVNPTYFEYQIEEEAGYDGVHINEDNGYIAVSNASLLYGLPYADYSMSVTLGSQEVVSSTYEEIPYWIEEGCNTNLTKIWIQIPILKSQDSILVYAYYGNPDVLSKSNKSAVFSYPFKKSFYYVLDGDIASGDLQISAYYNDTSYEIGTSSGIIDKQQLALIPAGDLNVGSALKSNKPLSTTTLVSGNGDALTPKIAIGKEFITYSIRGVEYLTILSLDNDNLIEIYDVSSGVFTKVGSLTLNAYQSSTFSYDFLDGNSIYVNSSKPILLHRRAETDYDLFTVFSPSLGWYGVPSQNLGIVALRPNTQVTIYRSDQSTPTTVTLTNAGDSYTLGTLGTAGNAPAFYVNATKPISVMAWADGDGTEGTTFLPENELDNEYILPADAEYVAIATKDAIATCYIYDANGTLSTSTTTSYTSTQYPYPGYIRFGGTVLAGSKINCTSPFFAYFERANLYETNLYGPKHFREGFLYSIRQTNRTEEDVYNNLKNNGNTTLRGYLYMIVEEETSTGWSLVFPDGVIINDRADNNLRSLLPGDFINLTDLWKQQGGWYTSSREPKKYRVYIAFQDESGLPIKDSYGNRLEDYYIFEIIPSELTVTRLEHENMYKGNVKEYEVGDNIALINVSVKALNNTAIDAQVELDLVKLDKTYAGFGPLNEIYSCGNIPKDSECYAVYDNTSNGYDIPLNAQGDYIFYWNVTMTLQNGEAKYNGTEHIKVHDLRNNVSSTLQPTRIYIGKGQASYYNFTIFNPWSVNISYVNVTINCDATLNCTCSLPNQLYQPNYCYLGNVSGREYAYANFTVNYTSSTTQGDYVINATLEYYNIGDEFKKWYELAPQTLEVRYQGILAITPYTYPSRVVRGQSGYVFETYINNTADFISTNAWLNYTLPAGWSNTSGNLYDRALSLNPSEIFWNNITVFVGLSSSLGVQTVRIDSGSDQGQEDFKNLQVEVYAKPRVLNIVFNDSNVSQGEQVIIYAQLIDDLGDPIQGETLRFYDENESIFIGSATTDANGNASIVYTLPSNALTGLHYINVSFFENPSSYLLYAENYSWLDVGEKPKINAIWHDPYEISYGGNISIYVNTTDDDGISNVELYITYANGTQQIFNMIHLYGDIYNYNISDLWDYGSYTYYVVVEDITGSRTSSLIKTFNLVSYAKVYILTDNESYPPNTDVYLVSNMSWYYKDRYYKKKIVLENNYGFNLNNSFELIQIDTRTLISQGKLDDRCENLAFTYYNATSNQEQLVRHYVIPGSCNSEKTYIYVEIPLISALSNSTIFMYYDSVSNVKKYYYGEINITSFEENITIHYPVSSVHNGSDAYAVSYVDGYMEVGTTPHVMIKGSPELISQTEMVQNTPIKHNVPVSISSVDGDGDAFPSIAMAGKRFTYRMDRGVDRFYIMAVWQDANCNIYDSTTLVDSFTVNKGQAVTRNTDITDGNAGILECDAPVLAFHDATGNDAYVMYPVSKEWYGVASNYLMISALEDNTYVEYYKSDGSTNSSPIILNRGQTYIEIGLGSQGNGPAVYVKANKPIGVNTIADGDGTDGAIFLPGWELSNYYIFPEDFEYIAVAVPYSFTKCDLLNQNDLVIDSKISGNLQPPHPGQMLFGSGNAGYRLRCNNSVYAYYEQLSGNRETNIFGAISNRIGYGYNATNKYILEEYVQGSKVINHGNISMHYYLVAYVEQNTTNGWKHIETIINDTSTGTLRKLNQYESFDIASLWNQSPFNTDLYPKGTYRVKADLVDKEGNVMQSVYGVVTNHDLFNITAGELKLNITQIRIYNVTYSLNPRTSEVDLEKASINDTFIMYVSEIYRIEVDVNVSSTSSIWWINTTNVSYENLNSDNWVIKYQDIWYRNSTDINDRIGGNFSFNILTWNTTDNDGKEDPSGKVTFYYILNLTNAVPEERQVVFKVIGNGVGEQDISTFKILPQDRVPPVLYNNTYDLNTSWVIRGDDALVYARWNEEIGNALVEYNSTTPVLVNYTITLPSPNPYNWTNYTLDTTSAWLLGNHAVKIYAEDISGNMNSSLKYLILSVYGLASITNSYVNTSTIGIGEYVEIHCQVKDLTSDPVSAIESYKIVFYNESDVLGINYTNSSGYASWIYNDYFPGYETIGCYIEDNKTRFYKVDQNNYNKSFTIFTQEFVPPYYTEVWQNSSIIHKGEFIELNVYWHDNFQLDYALLELNSSGTFQNISSINLNKQKDAWANFTYQYPISYSPGFVAWREYANDTSGNLNYTSPLKIFEVWGWAKLDSITLNPSSMYVGNSTIISCKVIDANSTSPLGGYLVRFYNETHLLGINHTSVDGIATWNYTDYTEGKETITCEILDNETLMYNASYPRNISTQLNTVLSGDAYPPKIVNNLYGLNVSYTDKVFRNETVLLYALWDEEINYSWYEVNTTSPNMEVVYVPGHVNNWTNHTIQLNYSWIVGRHYVKLYANDTTGNVNDTLWYLNFSVWGFSRVDWISPKDGQEVNRSIIYLITNVSDADTWWCINGYKVDYYDNVTPGYYIGSAYTDENNNCYANLTWDASNTDVGYHKLTAIINDDPDKFYLASSSTSSITIIIVILGALNTTILSPLEGQKLYRGQSYWFNSTTKDDTGQVITPDNATWYDNQSYLASQENFTYTIPSNAPLGYHLIEINTSAPYYQRGHDEIIVEYWSKADVNVTSPYNGSTVYINNTIQIECSVTDYITSQGIQNYNVSFYIQNSTYNEYLGYALTDANGIATMDWFVNESKYVKNTYYDVVCTIGSEVDLWYDVNISVSKSTVYLNETIGQLWVELIFPQPGITTYVDKDNNFYINATVTCKFGTCGEVNATALYNNLPISTVIGDQPFYINDGLGNPRICSSNLMPDQSCNVSFVVNATGDYGSIWNISVNFTSNLGMYNKTQDAEVFIGYVLILSVEPSEISYWYLPPSDPAQNYLVPPVQSVDPSTSLIKAANTTEVKLLPGSADANGGLWIKGENLTSSTSSSVIPVWNLTRCLGRVEDYPTPQSAQACWSDPANKLSYEYKQVLTTMVAGDWINITIFLDSPPVYADKYSGNITIMVNATY